MDDDIFIDDVETDEDVRKWVNCKKYEGMDDYDILKEAERHLDVAQVKIVKDMLKKEKIMCKEKGQSSQDTYTLKFKCYNCGYSWEEKIQKRASSNRY